MTPCKVQNHYRGSVPNTGRARKSKDTVCGWPGCFSCIPFTKSPCCAMLGACYACQPLLAPCMHSTRCASHHDTQWTCSQPLTWQTPLRCHDQRSTRQNTQQFQATAPTSCLCSTLPARRGPSNCSISADSPLPPLSCAASLQLLSIPCIIHTSLNQEKPRTAPSCIQKKSL